MDQNKQKSSCHYLLSHINVCISSFVFPKHGDTVRRVVTVPSPTTRVARPKERRAASSAAACSTDAKPALAETCPGSRGEGSCASLSHRPEIFAQPNLFLCACLCFSLLVIVLTPTIIVLTPRKEARSDPNNANNPSARLKGRGSLEPLAGLRRWLLSLCNLSIHAVVSAVRSEAVQFFLVWP